MFCQPQTHVYRGSQASSQASAAQRRKRNAVASSRSEMLLRAGQPGQAPKWSLERCRETLAWAVMFETAIQEAEGQRLLNWLRRREQEMARLLAELVAVPTENPPGRNYDVCAKLLEDRLRQLRLPCEPLFGPDGKEAGSELPGCVSTRYGPGSRTVYFHGHYDVVPAQAQEQFRPTRQGHFLFGRGACDMKGGIVAMLYAILALRECGVDLDGQVHLILIPDEETGGARGSRWLAERGLLGRNGVAMFLAEPTSGVVWNSNRGAISLRVEVQGKAAHVGLQHKGKNAFEAMVQVIQGLQELKQEVEQRVTQYPVGAEQRRNSILLIGGASGGGTNFNVVPEKCWFTLDRRINPEEDLAEEKARMVAVLEQCRRQGIGLTWQTLQEGPSAASPSGTDAGQALAQAIRETTGEAAPFEMCSGLLETRFYIAQGVPSFAYGPGLFSVAHGPNEYIDMRKVVECAVVYALAARQLLQH